MEALRLFRHRMTLSPRKQDGYRGWTVGQDTTNTTSWVISGLLHLPSRWTVLAAAISDIIRYALYWWPIWCHKDTGSLDGWYQRTNAWPLVVQIGLFVANWHRYTLWYRKTRARLHFQTTLKHTWPDINNFSYTKTTLAGRWIFTLSHLLYWYLFRFVTVMWPPSGFTSQCIETSQKGQHRMHRRTSLWRQRVWSHLLHTRTHFVHIFRFGVACYEVDAMHTRWRRKRVLGCIRSCPFYDVSVCITLCNNSRTLP